VPHGPAAGHQRAADLGIALNVEAGEGERVRTVVTPSGPFMLTGSVEPPVREPTDAPSETGLDSVAPPAGLAVRISGTTQATAPAAATADMWPIA
jgi:hypothetical protein